MLPTAHQSKPTEAVPANSPFAGSARTHFARMAVIDDTIYNGPVPSDTLYAAARGLVRGTPDGAVIKPVDQLTSPYLLFSVDCDAGNDGELRDYLCELWELAGPKLALTSAFVTATRAGDLRLATGKEQGSVAIEWEPRSA